METKLMAKFLLRFLGVLLLVHTTRSAGYNFARGLKQFFTPVHGAQFANGGFGTMARSMVVHNTLKQMRRDKQSEITKDMVKTIITLTLDVGGGGVLPAADILLNTITDKNAFHATRKASQISFNGEADAFEAFLSDWSDPEKKEAAGRFLRKRKKNIRLAFKDDMKSVMKRPQYKKFFKHMKRLKWSTRVGKLVNVLGPVFDIVNIGISTDTLVEEATKCNNQRSYKYCNHFAMASASLCILSGVAGIAGFLGAGAAGLLGVTSVLAGPAAPIVAVVFAMIATMIDLLDLKPPVDHEAISFEKHIKEVLKLDQYSRGQLEIANKFLTNSGINNLDIYTINQGHLPTWFTRDSQNARELSGPIVFGKSAEQYDDKGRRRNMIKVYGKCSEPELRMNGDGWDEPKPSLSVGDPYCEYLEEGKYSENTMKEKITSHQLNRGNKPYEIGPDFYGFAMLLNHELEVRPPSSIGQQNAPIHAKEGVMVLINTDQVTNYDLIKMENEGKRWGTSTTEGLRGIDIDTEEKITDRSRTYNDVIAIASMRNLKDGSVVKIRTGGGRDVLNIDEWVTKLDVDLGDNHNTLSVAGMRLFKKEPDYPANPNERHASSIDTHYYGLQFKGIRFRPHETDERKGGVLEYETITYDTDKGYMRPYEYHEMGPIAGVGILIASGGHDIIHLYAYQKDELNKDNDFSVYKFDGWGGYNFDAKKFKPSNYGDNVPHFKVIDNGIGYHPRAESGPYGRHPDCKEYDYRYEVNLRNGRGALRCTGDMTDPEGNIWDGEGCKCPPDFCIRGPRFYITNLEGGSTTKSVQLNQNKIKIYDKSDNLLATFSFHTKCPLEISATDEDEGVVIAPGTLKEHLDTMSYRGDRKVHKFQEKTEGRDNNDDTAYLRCFQDSITSPTELVNIDRLVINEKFFEECDIDGEDDGDVTFTKNDAPGEWTMTFADSNDKFQGAGKSHKVKVKEIVNEYGTTVADLSTETETFKLYRTYADKTTPEKVEKSILGSVVKNNLLLCINKAKGKGKRDGTPGLTDDKDGESEDCEE